MAEFNTKCPHCNAELVADEDWIGMELECPICKQTFIVAKETPKPPKLSMPQIKPETPTENTSFEHKISPAIKNAESAKGSKFPFVCPSCGTYSDLNIGLLGKQYTCPSCCETTIAVEATEKTCPFCGEKIKFNAIICRFCQRNLGVQSSNGLNPNITNTSKIKSRTTYVLLALFLGGFGVHDFYAGYSKRGIIKLILSVTGVLLVFPAIVSCVWSLVDIFTIKQDAEGIPFN